MSTLIPSRAALLGRTEHLLPGVTLVLIVTAAAYGLAPANATYQRGVLGPSGFDTMIEMWLPLAWSVWIVERTQPLYLQGLVH